MVGLVLMAGLVFSVFLKARKSLMVDFSYGRLRMAVLGMFLIYNVTEAGYKATTLMFFVLLLVAFSFPARQPAENLAVAVARPQRRVARQIERRQAECVLAVACAIGDELLAIEKSIVEIGITRAVPRHSAADLAAEIDLGPACRTHRPASFDRRRIGDVLHREVLAVAQPHAIGDAAATTAG